MWFSLQGFMCWKFGTQSGDVERVKPLRVGVWMDMVVCICNPSTQEAETGGWQV
jgi:phosphoribosyl-AMP cyclohydrolase